MEEAVRSYAQWWADAGVHTPTAVAPNNWRRPPAAQILQKTRVESPPPAKPAIAAPVSGHAPLPRNLDGFLGHIATDSSQPDSAWAGPAILPPAVLDAPLLVLVDMPGATAMGAAGLLDPGHRRLLDGMLASIGLQAAVVPVSALCLRRPPAGSVDETTLARLADRMRHYLALTRPRAVMIFGDRTSRAMFGAGWSPGSRTLLAINLEQGNVPAVALPAADLLMARPAAKAGSWQSLQLLRRIVTE